MPEGPEGPGGPADDDPKARLRALPKVDEVLRRPELAAAGVPRWAVAEAVRRLIDGRRRAILDGRGGETEVASDEVLRTAGELVRPSLRRVINATGVVLHTNLGRAPLAALAAARAAEVARGYSNLEYDVDERTRGSRHDHLQTLVRELTGAEAACVVNNNAAAVLLGLAALGDGRGVVVSRGELVEIGGSFRIPDVMRWSGARLVEVGTTNKTHLRDYQAALDAPGADVAVLLKVHQSNFAQVGFVAEVPVAELVTLGRAQPVPVPVMVDLGSGTLIDPASLSDAGWAGEPTVPQVIAAGADLVAFSGDKLLGGPQAGVLVGRAEAVARVKRHPLMRALRPDKLTLAALEATLALYREGPRRVAEAIPTWRMLAATPTELRARAESLRAALDQVPGLYLAVVETRSAVGGGALPTSQPASWALALRRSGDRAAVEDLEAQLRRHDPPIVARIEADLVILDVRTLADDELATVAAAVRTLAGSPA